MKKLILGSLLGIGALTATNLTGVGISTASAAVQEINNTVEGQVIEVGHNYFVMENKKLDEKIHVKYDFKSTVKVGEYVKVIHNGPTLQNAFKTFATATSIEHLDLAPGDYEDFVVGHVSNLYPKDPWGNFSVKVDFPTKKGNVISVIVMLEPEKNSSFKLNDLVKVETGDWEKTNPPEAFGGIEKVKSHVDSVSAQTNASIWIWD
ncbi:MULTISPECIES: hypothetical protein [unclassified Bacillus (in: firmicutes)]|uniref:hypothetical protein n=1 Tax=unclassified Bacillus (in: firmicutes) TaxID=185979 RepID=UPI0006960670|nr:MULTISPECIES: hypothetical protein [unclassified Bacillus (in: firmicutes)]